VSDRELPERLAAWGAGLAFPAEEALAADVVAALGRRRPRRPRPLLAAAAVVLAVASVVVAVPDGRRAVARWLGLEQLRVEVVGALPPAARAELGDPTTLGDAAARAGVVPYVATTLGPPVAIYAPGGRYVAVRYDDRGAAVLVTTLPGRIDDVTFGKIATSQDQVRLVTVDGADAIWITGDEHLFVYERRDGTFTEARPASDTLAWQRGDVILRVEGAVTLERALDVAAGLTAAEVPEG
jgi:hypothetical protein